MSCIPVLQQLLQMLQGRPTAEIAAPTGLHAAKASAPAAHVPQNAHWHLQVCRAVLDQSCLQRSAEAGGSAVPALLTELLGQLLPASLPAV